MYKRQLFDFDAKMAEIAQMENQTYEAGFWDDPAKAQELISQLNRKRDIVKGYQKTAAAYDEAEAALEPVSYTHLKRNPAGHV